jgi:hypothetical protein
VIPAGGIDLQAVLGDDEAPLTHQVWIHDEEFAAASRLGIMAKRTNAATVVA